jgi:hypothetical protein
MSFQFKITLSKTNSQVWRQILVPDHYTFYQFHPAIPAVFGWEHFHLFQFCDQKAGKLCYEFKFKYFLCLTPSQPTIF